MLQPQPVHALPGRCEQFRIVIHTNHTFRKTAHFYRQGTVSTTEVQNDQAISFVFRSHPSRPVKANQHAEQSGPCIPSLPWFQQSFVESRTTQFALADHFLKPNLVVEGIFQLTKLVMNVGPKQFQLLIPNLRTA